MSAPDRRDVLHGLVVDDLVALIEDRLETSGLSTFSTPASDLPWSYICERFSRKTGSYGVPEEGIRLTERYGVSPLVVEFTRQGTSWGACVKMQTGGWSRTPAPIIEDLYRRMAGFLESAPAIEPHDASVSSRRPSS